MQTTGLAEAPASHDTLNSAMWHARCAVLALLGVYLHASPHVQRLAVRKWNIVPVLIGLLWEQPIQKLALDMVCLFLCCMAVSTVAVLMCICTSGSHVEHENLHHSRGQLTLQS